MLPTMPSFADWFASVWGVDPYPWQRRLAAAVCAGDWPDALGIPTGAGKTAAIDVAIYAMAAEAHRAPGDRRQPRRIVLVVDRRTVVDQGFDRAVAIRERLDAAEDGPCAAVRARLQALMGHPADPESLAVTVLRGGLPRDDGWARRPDQPLVAVSTVDQVGSRLLFRGYGVRPTMLSVHAGLLGADTLFLLDEVHLSRPFEETLDAVARRWRHWREVDLPDRWRFVRMSATSGDTAAFGLQDEDHRDPRLARRLTASRHLRVAHHDGPTHKGTPAEPHRGWVDALAREARAMLAEGRQSIAVVVNRVDTAREVARALEVPAKGAAPEVVLLTGRMRAADRDEAVGRVRRRAGPDRATADAGAPPFAVVATQCIEAGADLDFDGMVSELCSIDALVQRLGRVNRTGLRGDCPVVVLAPKLGEADPVYGAALAPTLAWLTSQVGEPGATAADFGARAALAPAEARPARETAAVLLPAHLDLLSQTAPLPDPDPQPEHYLHGLRSPPAEVQIVWRADADLDDAEATAARLDQLPPCAHESISLPLAAARRWLRGEAAGSFADAGGAPDEEVPRGTRGGPVGFVRGPSGWTPAGADALYPHALLVLPAGRGGIAAGNFDPAGSAPCRDLGDLASTLRTGRPTVRLDLRVHADPAAPMPAWPAGVPAPPPVPEPGGERGRDEARRELRAWLARIEATAPPLWRALARRPSGVRALVVAGHWLLQGPPLGRADLLALGRDGASPVDGAATADDGSSLLGRRVGLDAHLRGVERWATRLADACGLPADLVADLGRAGRWHDLGKADPRFQLALYGADEIEAAGSPLLAKSATPAFDRAGARRAARAARLPGGFRHEMASVALLLGSEAGRALLAAARDPDLVLHLVAAHHGHARPFAPVEDHRGQDPALRVVVEIDGTRLEAPSDHGMDRADSGVADRYHRLVRRYGWWGLAWLEAILRLADHRESEAESHEEVPS
jgi:CRISPR-associated endonuclease/helicase Cas3